MTRFVKIGEWDVNPDRVSRYRQHRSGMTELYFADGGSFTVELSRDKVRELLAQPEYELTVEEFARPLQPTGFDLEPPVYPRFGSGIMPVSDAPPLMNDTATTPAVTLGQMIDRANSMRDATWMPTPAAASLDDACLAERSEEDIRKGIELHGATWYVTPCYRPAGDGHKAHMGWIVPNPYEGVPDEPTSWTWFDVDATSVAVYG